MLPVKKLDRGSERQQNASEPGCLPPELTCLTPDALRLGPSPLSSLEALLNAASKDRAKVWVEVVVTNPPEI